jgi:hypothetical protein
MNINKFSYDNCSEKLAHVAVAILSSIMVVGSSDSYSKGPGNRYHRSSYINKIEKVNKKNKNK